MKKLLFLFALVLAVALQSNAQVGGVVTLPLAAGDTVVNTATITKTFGITGDYKGIVVQAKWTEISGTTAGTIKMQASIDGTLFTDVASQTGSATDVVSGQLLFYAVAPLARYYRVTWTGTGAMSDILTIRYRITR